MGLVSMLNLLPYVVLLQDINYSQVEHHIIHLTIGLTVIILNHLFCPRRHVNPKLDLEPDKIDNFFSALHCAGI